MALLERDIENEVVKWANKNGFLTPKVRFVEDGWPDRLFISPKGHTIFVEFKRPGEKPKRLQEYRISQLQARGIPAFWSDNDIECISYLKAALESSPVSGTGNTNAPVASLGRVIPGPRIGKNEHSVGDIFDTEEARALQEDAHNRTPEADV